MIYHLLALLNMFPWVGAFLIQKINGIIRLNASSKISCISTKSDRMSPIKVKFKRGIEQVIWNLVNAASIWKGTWQENKRQESLNGASLDSKLPAGGLNLDMLLSLSALNRKGPGFYHFGDFWMISKDPHPPFPLLLVNWAKDENKVLWMLSWNPEVLQAEQWKAGQMLPKEPRHSK